ncbi:MAG: domain containing protein [Chitinophagaceae bacterium]|nr:domain containing protein [Chitinophagaceae bacterium]
MKNIFLLKALLSLLFLAYTAVGQISGNWKDVGPLSFPVNSSGQINGIGRATQLKFHPTNSQKMYATTATGGLYITIDGGNNWTPSGTDNLFRTNCASVCVDYTNDQTLYLGTGDPNYYSNYYGVYKSTNGGQTWTAANSGLGNRLTVELLMSPSNNNVLIAATGDGIWKTTDGGNSWTEKLNGGDFTEMVFKPGDPNTIYAATHTQFYVSTNQGDSWSLISLPGSGFQNGGRIGVSKANPNVVYLTFVGNFSGGTTTPVLKSTNSGQSFSVVKTAGGSNLNGYDGASDGQGNYNYAITVDPTNANTVYIASHVVWKSTDGGVTWTQLTNWYAKVHTDMHQIVISPYDNTKIFNANDGGVWLSTDGGNNWSTKSDGLDCTECYHAAQSPIRKDMIDIGTQDNGELNYTTTTWYTNGGGDFAGNVAFDYQNNTDVYHLGNDRTRKRLSASGSAPSLNFPFAVGDGNGNDVEIEFSPLQTNVGFVGKSEVYITTNISANPPTWKQITNINVQVQAIASSPADANLLYVVGNNNKVYRSDNALAATPTFTTLNAPGATNVKASIVGIKSNSSLVYMTCGSKVYRSTDKGVTWSDVTGSIPNVNIIKIYNDTYTSDESVYIGMATGIYYRNSSMTDWINYSKGLPTIANINEFMLFNDGTTNAEIRVAYFGRGVWGSTLYGKAALRDPENPPITVNGLDYKYYEGTWNNVPDFNSITPIKTGTTTGFTLDPRNRDTQFGLRISGYINVPTDGTYTFYTSSDDGSKLYIGSTVIVNNDGIHGMVEQSGTIGLKAGKHAIMVDMFQNAGGLGLTVSYSGPSIAKTVIDNTVTYRIPPATLCSNTGTITRDYWANIGGTDVSQIPVTTAPTSTTTLTLFEAPSDVADNYGQRVRGYLCAPYTGAYTFWIASDDNSELWLSTTTSPTNKVKIAYLNGAVASRNWTANPSQQSASINLIAGQQYYVEALQKEGGGDDFLAVGWQIPTGAMERPIPGIRLSPYVPINSNPTVSITAPANNASFIATSNITFTATATDSDGNVAKVDFYNGTTPIGTSTTSPYTFTWNNVSAGTYSITAIATDNQGGTGTSSVVNITVTPLRTPENPANALAGIIYKYYESATSWTSLPNFSTLTPVKSGIASVVDISLRNRDTNYGLVFTGFINVPTDGIYTFYTTSDDGTSLFIGSTQVVSNDGVHGDTEQSGTIGLKAGKHAFTVNYFQGIGGQSLSMSYAGPGITKQVVPSSALFNNNVSPTISITAPTNNATFTAPATITITAAASDQDGSIAKVEFYNGTSLLGTSTTSPYTFSWISVIAGSYTINAKAYDNVGVIATASVTVKVNPAANINPTVSITSPTNNASFSAPASISIAATATDSDGSIAKVEFYNGTLLLGTATTSPYTFSWANVAAGAYTINAKAYDNSGGTATATVSVNVNSATNVNPTVSITSPLNNAKFTAPATVSIAATATDSDGSIAKVEFYNGTSLLGTATTSPYAFSWTNVAAGSYTIVAKAYDNLNATTTASVAITVNNPNQLPVISITSPSNNSSFTAPAAVSITASASDSDGSIAKVEFYNGTSLLGTAISSPYNFGWNNVAAGTYTIVAKAYDNLNATVSASVSITVNNANTPPSVSITSPANNATFNAPATVSISVSATDADGTISKVEFYNGTNLLGNDLSSPYSYTWSNVAAAPYTINVKAYDNTGAISTASVNITVNAVNACAGIPDYVENNGYVPGSTVKSVGNKYQCKPWPYSGWCNGASWAYGPGVGAYWTDAWTLVSSCNAPAAMQTELSSDGIEASSVTVEASAYPNPFENKTSIKFELEKEGNVTVSLFNAQGVKVSDIFNGYLSSGLQSLDYLNTQGIADGAYICRIQSGDKIISINVMKVTRPRALR